MADPGSLRGPEMASASPRRTSIRGCGETRAEGHDRPSCSAVGSGFFFVTISVSQSSRNLLSAKPHGAQRSEPETPLTTQACAPGHELLSLACGCRSSRELEHVGALRVLGALSALLGRQRAIGVYPLFESLEECFSRGARARSAVVRTRPRDFRCDAPVDVLGHGRVSLP
jgi:hypothetical protein